MGVKSFKQFSVAVWMLLSAGLAQAQPAPVAPPAAPAFGMPISMEQAQRAVDAAMAEAKRLNISVDQADYEAAVARLESQNRIPSGKLWDYLSEHGVDPASLQNQIRASLTWSRVVRRRATGFISITDRKSTRLNSSH